MTDANDNPFSFKKFVKDPSVDVKISKTDDNSPQNEPESGENPFSFKAFVGGVPQTNAPSDESDKPIGVLETELHLPLFDGKEELSDLDSPDTSDQSVLGVTDFTDDLSPSLFGKNSNVVDLMDSDFFPVSDFRKNTIDESLSLPPETLPIDDVFTSSSNQSKTKSEIDSFKTELNEARQLLEKKDKRIAHLEKEISFLQKKEKEETSALEEVIHKVEENLKLSTERTLQAEKVNATLTEKIQHQQIQLQQLQTENVAMKNQLDGLQYKETMKYVSDQLKVAANGAKLSLNQMLDGVSHLHQLSELLKPADITEVKSDSNPDKSWHTALIITIEFFTICLSDDSW